MPQLSPMSEITYNFNEFWVKFLSLNGINIVVVITGLCTQCVIDLANLKLLHAKFYLVI